MHGTNPFALAGWYNPANPQTVNTQPWGISEFSGPSIFGALPFDQSQNLPTILSFHYVCLSPNVLNCKITGPTSVPYLDVSTSGSRTVFRRSDGRVVAALDWGATPSPTIEMENTISKRSISSWMRISADRTRHTVTINGKEFMWVAGNNCISLAEYGQLARPLARIFTQGNQAITLEMTTEAFHLGALDASIVAAVIFHSGRDF